MDQEEERSIRLDLNMKKNWVINGIRSQKLKSSLLYPVSWCLNRTEWKKSFLEVELRLTVEGEFAFLAQRLLHRPVFHNLLSVCSHITCFVTHPNGNTSIVAWPTCDLCPINMTTEDGKRSRGWPTRQWTQSIKAVLDIKIREIGELDKDQKSLASFDEGDFFLKGLLDIDGGWVKSL